MKPIAPNTMIQNRYLVVQLIGQGSTGDVYLAVDQRFGSAVALKRAFYRGDTAKLAAFEREAAALKRLNHPVLPKVIDHFAENDGLFLVMEHISGDDLSKRLENANKPFPLSWVMFWADQALDTLNYMHSHVPPIVHGDIRPQNLKLTSENHIILLDSGTSVGSTETAEAAASSDTEKVWKPFASPEKLEGADLDTRADIYALSATLYNLLTNVLPADGEDRVGAVASGLDDTLKPVADVNNMVPTPISDIIMKGLALLPGERFNTAADMQQQLRRVFNKGTTAERATLVNAKMDPAVGAVTNLDIAAIEAGNSDSMDFGATLQMDPVPVVVEPKQSAVKTEVYSTPPSPVTGEKTEVLPKPPPPAEKTEVMPPPAEETEVMPPPITSERAAVAATVLNAGVANPSQVTHIAPAKAKSSKAVLVVGLFVGLGLIVLAVGGGGWYAYNVYYKQQPVPTPLAIPPTPLPSPSPEVVERLEDSSNTNTANELVDPAEENDNRKPAQLTTAQETTKTQPKTTNPVTPQRTPGQKPATRSTPKAAPRDDRTVILQ